MKTRKKAASLICIAILTVILYLGLVPGAAVHSQDPAVLAQSLGFLSLIPPLTAVLLAFLLHDVILSLLAGFLFGALLLMAVSPSGLAAGPAVYLNLVLNTVLDIVTDRDNACILLLCLTIGGMVEVIRNSGGFDALAKVLMKKIDTPKKASLIGELLGIIVFFDDYANSLIVGPVMKPVTDHLRVSREKLAYIVDSTAAPVTGIAVISSWVAVEVSIINQGFAEAGISGEGYAVFLKSIPFSFYCLFTLLFMFIKSLMGRDYGPMLQAENRARRGYPECPGYQDESGTGMDIPEKGKGKRIAVALIPILLLCVTAMISFYFDGREALIAAGTITAETPFSLELLAMAFGSADTYYLVMSAAMIGSAAAILLSAAFRLNRISVCISQWIHGASQLLMTVIILVLAWGLASMVSQLGTVNYVVNIISLNVPYFLIPTLIFCACCAVSFAVGSYGCMFIAMPMAIPLAVKVMQNMPSLKEGYLLVCIASVLSGGIFGDHCSPITDCTILSSRGAGCDNMAHVETQMPYALTTAAISILAGTLPAGLGCPSWLSLILGLGMIAAVLKIFGRVPGRVYIKKKHLFCRTDAKEAEEN